MAQQAALARAPGVAFRPSVPPGHRGRAQEGLGPLLPYWGLAAKNMSRPPLALGWPEADGGAAVAIEALMLVFKFALTDPSKMTYALILLGGVAGLLISLAYYIKSTRKPKRESRD